MKLDFPTVRARLAEPAPNELEPGEPMRLAAVSAILRQDPAEGLSILYIKRTEHPSDPWSGHMAFPGGRHDEEDPDLLHTAVRETLEEIGLDLRARAIPLGRLDDLPAIARGRRTGLVIRPFVWGLTEGGEDLRLDRSEVEELHWAPLLPLLRGERDAFFSYRWNGIPVPMPAFEVGEHKVWGLTYQMSSALFSKLKISKLK